MADLHQVPITAFHAVKPAAQPEPPKGKLLLFRDGRTYIDLPTVLSLLALIVAIIALVQK